MINCRKLISNIGLNKIFLFLTLASSPAMAVENISHQNNSITASPEQNLSIDLPVYQARAMNQSEINQMINELQQLLNRVESTLIQVEAQQDEPISSMSDAVNQIVRQNSKATLVSNGQLPKSSINYSNTRAKRAIESAKQVLRDFPVMARQDVNLARRMWLNARRDLWMSYPMNKHLAQPEIRAMWLDRGTIVKAKSKQDLVPLFDRMAKAGINTVFMETLNASYPIYPSRVAPQQNPMTKGWDPLQASIELAHERDMELHAWLWAFAAANQGHNRILNQPQQYLGPVLSRRPDWVLKDQNGRVFNRTPGFKKAFFDPANPEVRRYLLSLIDEIATKYDVDGIQLDYIRYPFQDSTTKQQFGYTNVSRSLFKQRYGVDPKNISRSSYLWSTWTGFRVEQVTKFVEQTSQLLKTKHPELILSTAVFPMGRRQRLDTLQQNWEDWSYNQSVDMVVLMTYAMDTGSFAERIRLIYDLAGQNSNFVIPAIRLLNVPETEAFDQMQLIRNTPAGGFALFAAENFDNSLATIFSNTQGQKDEIKEPIPYRQPFATSYERYQALRQEWVFLLQNEQINIDRSYLLQWSEESDELSQILQQLVTQPTVANTIAAQKKVAAYRLRLSRYLGKQKQINPWQVESWMNRLGTIENVLRYGQSMIANQTIDRENLTNKK